jgi:glutaredoxin 2
MTLRIQVDGCGWFPADPPHPTPRWESVTCDEMVVTTRPRDDAFPPLNDVVAVRRHFQQLIRSRAGALVSCDVVGVSAVNMVRTVSKYRTEDRFAMAFAASLTALTANYAVELSIRGREDGFTGIREAIVTSELLRTAGPSVRRQLNEKKIPIEFMFERYAPDTQPALCFVVSDDEKYDSRFPDHPVTRVRRWLRRQERAFAVTLESAAEPPAGVRSRASTGLLGSMLKKFGSRQANGGLHAAPGPEPIIFEVRYLPVAPMGYDELMRELGAQVTADSLMPEVFRKMNPSLGVPSLAARQKNFRDQREASAKAMMEQHQQGEAELKKIREDAQQLAQQLRGADTFVYLARERPSGHWLTIREGGQAGVLAVFTSAAIVDDFLLCKNLNCEPVQTSVSQLIGLMPSLRNQNIVALELDRCPRCAEVRPVVQLSAIPSEGEFLNHYAARAAAKRFLVDKNVGIARKEADLNKRISILRYTGEHIDPGAPAVYIEIAKYARESGNSTLLENAKQTLAKYSPGDLASLDAR